MKVIRLIERHLRNIADAIAPMLYARSVLTDNAAFEARVSEFVTGAEGRQVWTGIIADSEYLPPEYANFDLIAQRIQIARWNGAAGQAIFQFREGERKAS